MKFSIILPTLQEERILAQTLKQFQDFPETVEVIVADGGSTDRTLEIAASFGVQVVQNEGVQTIGSNRNIGAKAATGDVLIFCDADTRIDNPAHFLQRIRDVFQDPQVVGAMPRIRVFPKERRGSDRVFHYFYNEAIRLSFLTPMAVGSGQCQIIRKKSFVEAGGYPAEQVHGEDSTLFRKLGKMGKLYYFKDLTIYESPRRYRHYGYLRYLSISTMSLIGQGLLGRNVLKEWKRVG
jgi:glycosyltransferase involved in cell wall biosynthesis